MLALTYRWSLDILFALAVAVFVALFFLSAPYGRYARPGWGITLPERWGWRMMELPAVAVIFLIFLFGGRRDPVSIVFIVIWEFHYVYRTFVFTSLMREGHREFPVLISVFAIFFNILNGYVNGCRLFLLGPTYPLAWFFDLRFLFGLALFAAGFLIHSSSDNILRALRKPGETGYSIPQGGMFRFVSCPNYFGEIIEWVGWALLTWSGAGLAFAAFTFANLFPRAIAHHRWYRGEFADYPLERKAVIPFIV